MVMPMDYVIILAYIFFFVKSVRFEVYLAWIDAGKVARARGNIDSIIENIRMNWCQNPIKGCQLLHKPVKIATFFKYFIV